ncbi:MAG TPA: prenyltransferase [Gammaproteobacteria bacterium]|nr:prenyltransferase [Gammaproteobacteria bacterium]
MPQQSDIPHSKVERWLGAFVGFYRPAVDELRTLDPVSKFLYSARSLILVISAQAAIIAGLLAAADRQFNGLYFALVLIGFVVAHMISNLSNDYFGYRRGHDTPDSPRMRYTVHPLASGVLEPRVLISGIAILALIGLGIAAFFVLVHGWLATVFAAAGIALLFAYDAAPVPLKSIGLGEVAVFLVWGPLMVGGGYAVIAGHVSIEAMLVSIPYGLGVMSILIGKHIDQREFDHSRGIHTLPVLLGESGARFLNLFLIVLMYAVTAGLILLGQLTPFAAVVLVALPRAARAWSTLWSPRPSTAPAGYVGWPLWYHRACLVHNRLFGWLYILGLAAGVIWPTVRW